MSNSATQGIYSPLPQSISDSDSEEELHSSITQGRKLHDSKSMMNGQMKEYHHIDDVDDGHINGFPNINTQMMDDIPIIKDGYKQPMSGIRKFLFILSIVLCFLIIIIFLWVLPCSENVTCSAIIANKHTSNWEKPYLDIELMGPINVVEGAIGHSRNLVFIFRRDVINGDADQILQNVPVKSGGAISIVGDTGKVAWFIRHPHIPTDIDCSLLDVDKNGEIDCIILGENGMLTAINPLYGNVYWYVHFQLGDNITAIDFPILLSDIDGDEVNDLLTVVSVNGSDHNNFVLISGSKGHIIHKATKDCITITELNVNANFLSFICKTETNFEKCSYSFQEFFTKVMNRKDLKYDLKVNQHSKSQMKENEENNYVIEGRQLIVRNQGHCPGQCNVSVQLVDQRSGKEGNIIWTYKGINMYGMVPTMIKFKESENNINLLQGHVNGFILKFWQWYDNKLSKFINSDKYQDKNLWDDVSKKKMIWSNLVRNKRSLLPSENKSNFTEQFLIERLVLITFNLTNFNIVNASQSEVIQLCNLSFDRACQPNLTFQENSVLVADLDKDGSQELISYLSTFVYNDELDKNDKFKLQSNVKVIRLENELPKLYEAVYKP